MSDATDTSGSSLKSFLIGALVVLVAALAWFIYDGNAGGGDNAAEITITVPDLPAGSGSAPNPDN